MLTENVLVLLFQISAIMSTTTTTTTTNTTTTTITTTRPGPGSVGHLEDLKLPVQPNDHQQNPYGNTTEQPKEPHPLQHTIRHLAEMNSNFGYNLYRKIASKHDNNIVLSPLSVSIAFALLSLGTNGETKAQLLQGLNLHLLEDAKNPHLLPALFQQLQENITTNDELLLSQGSSLFVRKDIEVKESFLNQSSLYFDTEVINLDFRNTNEALNIINHYVSKKTKGEIADFMKNIDGHAQLILLNWVLFKGKWLTPFDPTLTEIHTFHLDKYNRVKVPMMFKNDKFSTTFDKTFGCSILKLPYRGGASMLIVVPVKEGDYGVVEDHLSTDLVESWLQNMKTRKMDIYLPKFKLEQLYHMPKLLQELKIKKIFMNYGGLTGLSDFRDIKVTEVIHKAHIEVDERGTEAEAVTVIQIVPYALPATLKVDRPFLFVIYEESTRSLLFIGRVVNPTKL